MNRWKILLWAFILVMAMGIVVIAALIRRGFRATTQPSRLEAVVARTVRNLAIPADAREETDPLQLTAENLQGGREDFLARCAVCHAHDGSGITSIGRNLYPRVPD